MQQDGAKTLTKGFHKKGVRISSISGTKPSIHNNALLISCGVPSLDALIGGGIAVGSCLLVDEDEYNTYTSLILKYYLAEGIICKHKIFLASADKPPDEILLDLPQPITHEPKSEELRPTSGDEDSLAIAWRYKNMPRADPSSQDSSFGHYYDITKVMNKDTVSAADKTLYDGFKKHGESMQTSGDVYSELFNKIQDVIHDSHLTTAQGSSPNNILRIAISSMGSPYWSASTAELSRFLLSLRSLLRTSYSTCLLTVPGRILHDLSPLIRLADGALQFISLSDKRDKSSNNSSFKDFHGLVKLQKLPRINSLISHVPDTMDWVFKLKRKKLTIEKLHLPPDLSETVSRAHQDPVKAAGSCGQTSTGIKIDF